MHFCKYCGKELNVKSRKSLFSPFCNQSHKAMFYQKLRNDRLQTEFDIDEFIKSELNKPAPIINVPTENIKKLRVVANKCMTRLIDFRSLPFRNLKVKTGDIIDVYAHVVKRKEILAQK